MPFVNSSLVVDNAVSVSASVPAGTSNGNFMLMTCTKVTGSNLAWNVPAGWTKLFDEYNSGGAPDRQAAVFFKFADNEPASYTVSHTDSAQRMQVSIQSRSGIDGVNPFDVTYVKGDHQGYVQNAFNITFREITTVTDNAEVILIHFAGDDDITAAGAPAGYTTRVDGSSGTTGDPNANDAQQMIFDKVVATAGLESPGSTTHSGSSTLQDNDYWTLALRPGTPPASGPSITNVDADGEVTDGQIGATISLSGFTGAPTLTLKHGSFETAALSYTGDETGGTWNAPDYAALTDQTDDIVGVPVGQTVKLVATNGAEVAEFDIVIQPKAGWAVVTAASAGTGSSYLTSGPVADGSVALHSTANNTVIATDYLIQTDVLPVNAILWNSDTGIVEFVTADLSADTTKPVITLTGSATPAITEGDVWSDPGYSANDDTDGDITGSVVVAGDTVDPNTVGTYIITYNVSDAAGNAADQVTRTVTVNAAADVTPPVISLTGSTTYSIDEGDSWSEPGYSASDNVDGDITGSVVISGDAVDPNTVGVYVVRYNVVDAAGNAATEVTRTVTVNDITPPVITLTGSSSISIDEGDAWVEPGFSAVDNVDGDITGNVVIGGDVVNPNLVGTYVITYDVSDAAGNNATQITRTVTVVDITTPVITLIGSTTISVAHGSVWVDPGFTAIDNADGDISLDVVVGGTAVDTSQSGTYVITYNVADAAGNNAAQVIRAVTVEPEIVAYAAYASVVGMDSTNTQKLFLNELTDPQQWESADLSIILPVQ